jgi:hypothetical protein
MSNVIEFPKRRRVIKTKRSLQSAEVDRQIMDDEYSTAKRRATAERNYRWTKWQFEKRHWGGGHRKRDGLLNPCALATFNIDRVRWREHEYQQEIARRIVEVLFYGGVIAIGNSLPHFLYRQMSSGEWKMHMSDRMITRTLNLHLAFTRDHCVAVKPPHWLPQAVRFAAHDLMYVESEKDEDDDD